jgi:hypothetical protein
VDIWAPPPDALGWLLRPQPIVHFERAVDHLAGRLPHAVDSLVASDDLEMHRDGTIKIEPGAHPALFALASEATVRYGFSVEDLRQYLVNVLLPAGGDD